MRDKIFDLEIGRLECAIFIYKSHLSFLNYISGCLTNNSESFFLILFYFRMLMLEMHHKFFLYWTGDHFYVQYRSKITTNIIKNV